MTFSALILDFDGTVFDSETPIFEIWGEIFREHGQELTIEAWSKTLGTHGTFNPFDHLEELAQQPVDRDTVREEMRQRVRARCREEPLRPGIAELLEEGRRREFKTAVASSSSWDWINLWIDHHDIRHHFDTICSRDHVERVKPAPDLFLLAAERLEVAPERCIVFEDTPNGVHAARNAGMPCVAIPNALTRRLEFPATDLTLDSLAESNLDEILRHFGP